MADITVTTNQQVIEVTETGGVDVTNTTDTITILPSGTLIIQGPDTYSINASTVAGGANLNLLNSNGTNDAVKIASGTGITVSRTDADTITVTNTSPAGTTYTQNASATSGGANLNLVGSDATTDTVKFASGTNVTVSRTDADTISIASTDTNTTYTQNASSVAGGANLNLVGSDSTTDSVKFASGTGITVSRTDADTITITNNVVGDVVGPASATDNAVARFDTTTGKLIQNSNAILTDTGDLTLAGDLTVTGQDITTGADNSINITRNTSSTNSRLSPLTLRVNTTGTPAVGIGTSLAFETETLSGVNTTAGTIQVEATSVAAGSENFNMNFRLTSGGVEQERMFLTSSGNLVIDGDLTVSGNDIKSSSATALTLSGADVTVAGDLAVNGGDITTSAGTGSVFNTTATTLNIGGAATTVSIGANTGTTTVNNSLVADSLTLTTPLPVASGGTGRAVGNYSIYANEIHVGKDGNDTSGDGTLINPVLTITQALTLIGAGRNTVIIHPGSYSESPTVSSANTTIATAELTGANTQIAGTLTLSAAARVSGIKLTNLTITGSGNTYISNCTVDTQVIKSGSNYVEIINSELQCTSGIQITGTGTVSIVGNKCWAVTVSNASANVLIKDCYQVITPTVTAGTLQIDGSAIFAASPSSNAVTSSASSFITLANSFVLNSVGTNVERVSLSGFYSILNLVYDKPNSTLIATSATGGNLNAIDYFSVVNADTLAGTSGLTLLTVGSNGNITLDPNGTGNVVATLAAGGNLTNTTNYLRGTVGDATVLAAGDIFGFTNGAGTDYRGVLITNEDDTTKAPGVFLRGFTGGASAQPLTRPQFAFERARGTLASPTALQANDILGGFGGNGFTTGGWLRDVAAATYFPAVVNLSATENWISNTNVGTGFALLTMPTATPFTGTNLQATIAANPQVSQIRSDLVNIRDRTSNTNYVSLIGTFNATQPLGVESNLLSTNISSGASVGITTKYRQGFTATGSSISTTTLTVGTVTAGTGPAVGQALYGTGVAVGTTITANISGSGSGSTWTVSISQTTARTTISGSLNTALTLPQNADKLGNFRFNSNSDTAGTYALGAQVIAQATENWTSMANGSSIAFAANKQGQSWTTGHTLVITASPESAQISSDIITLENSAGTDYAVLDANTAKFNVPVTTELTTTTISEGTTYTPAATVDNNISVQINTLSGGTTVIDLINLTGNSRGGSYNILVFNNTASGTPIQVKNTRINSNNLTTHTITSGDRIIINAFVVGDYATATHLVVA